MSKNIYISGKITGVENFAEIFKDKEKELTEKGHKVYNPAKHPDMFSWQQFMELDLKALSFCDSIYMMKGWESSKGAKLELEEAKKLGLEIIYESPEQNINIENSITEDLSVTLEEIENKKSELLKTENISKNYLQDFEDKSSDESISDGELIKTAKKYIKELQDLIQINHIQTKNTSVEIEPLAGTKYRIKLDDGSFTPWQYHDKIPTKNQLKETKNYYENLSRKNIKKESVYERNR